jgi:hypothetical protein
VKWRIATVISLHRLEQYLEDVPQPQDNLGAGNGPDCGEHSERDFLDDRHAERAPGSSGMIFLESSSRSGVPIRSSHHCAAQSFANFAIEGQQLIDLV